MSRIPRAAQHVMEVKSEDCEVDVFLVHQALQEAQSQTGTTIRASTNTCDQQNVLEVQGIEDVIKSVQERCETLQNIADQSTRCLSIDADSNSELLDVAKLLSTCRHGLASLLQGQCCYYLLQGDYMQVYFYAHELKYVATKLSNETFLKAAKSWVSKKFVESNLNVNNQDTKLRLIKMQSEMLQNSLQFLQVWKSDEFALNVYLVLRKLYRTHLARCDFQLSLDLCIHLLQMSCDVRYKRGIIDMLADVAHLYPLLGKYWLSYKIMKKMPFSEIEDIRTRCVVTTNLSVVELLLKMKPESLQHAWDSLDLALKINDAGYIACAYGNIGLALEYLGNFNEAIEPYKECLRIGEEAGNYRVINNGLCNLGRAYQGLDGNENRRTAKEYFKRAVKTQRPPKAYWCDTEEFRFSGDYLLAKLAIEEKTWDDAVEHLREVIKRCEDLRRSIQDSRTKITFNDTQRKPFQYLQYVLLEQGKVMEALLIAEKGRGRVFSDNIESQFHMPLHCEDVLVEMIKSRGVAVLFISSLEEVGKLYFWFISSNGELLKHWSLPYVECDALLTKLCVALRNTQGRHEIEFRGSVPQEYSLIDKAFNLILPNSDAYSTLNDQEVNESSCLLDTGNGTLTTNTSRSGKCKTEPPSENYYTLSDLVDELSQLILSPFRKELREEFANNETDEIPRLLIIPQGKTFNIPFAALRIDGKPLCSHVSVIEAFSFNSFSYSSTESERRVNSGLIENALIVGNPTHDLPRAEEEAKLISEIFGVTPLLNVNATKEQVMKQLPSARLCHFACHGETGGKALVLASDSYHTSYRDCHLTASDVENMEINADLVVLSACHTARGKINSEGVLGLARACQTAGARTVVTALWAIPEAATKVFMSYFYISLCSGTPVADAIRATQVKMQERDDFKEVINWGSFKVFGANARIM